MPWSRHCLCSQENGDKALPGCPLTWLLITRGRAAATSRAKGRPAKDEDRGREAEGGIGGVMRGGKPVTEQVVEVAERHTGSKCSSRRHSCPKIIPKSLPAEFSHDIFVFVFLPLQFFGVLGAGSEGLPIDGAALGSQRGSLAGTCCRTQSNHSKDVIRGNSKGAGCGRGARQQICFLK